MLGIICKLLNILPGKKKKAVEPGDNPFAGRTVVLTGTLARRTRDGDLNFSALCGLSDEEVIEQLTSVKGIGIWTAHMFLIFSLGRLDVFELAQFQRFAAQRGMNNERYGDNIADHQARVEGRVGILEDNLHLRAATAHFFGG